MVNKVLNLCFQIIRWAPVVFITAVIVWSYYAYVVQMCIFTVASTPEMVIYLLLYHPLLVLFAWTYWQTIFTNPGCAPKEFHLSPSDLDRFIREEDEALQRDILTNVARNLPIQCRTVVGGCRFCEKCKAIKPDRAHHCSVCGSCILKMDHHCPWVNNCVNFTNYKFFVLFLGYALLYCLYIAGTSLQYFIEFWSGVGNSGLGNLHVLFLFFASIMFALSLLFLFGYHLHLVSKNRSTLESFRSPIFRSGPDKDGFSLGSYGNFLEIFGDDKRLWFLPVFSSLGDGVSYTVRNLPTSSSYQSMENRDTAQNELSVPAEATIDPPPLVTTASGTDFGDGVNFPIRTVDEDYDSLLGERQRWMEDGGEEGPGQAESEITLTRH